MKSQRALSILMMLCWFSSTVTLVGQTDGKRNRQQEEEPTLEKHLAPMGELDEQADEEDRRRPVAPPSPEPFTRRQKEHYEKLARTWADRLWATSGCYIEAPRTNVWTVPRSWLYVGIWTNVSMEDTPRVYPEPVYENQPWRQHVVAEFWHVTVSKRWSCHFTFLDRSSDKVVMLENDLFTRHNVPYRQDGRLIHTTEETAMGKAAEYAALFGVSNIWDKAFFMLRSLDFSYGTWSFSLTPNVNGYSTLYAVNVSIADLPNYPLARWHNDIDQIPTNLPTNVSLTAAQARAKGEEYLKMYFPLKALIPVLKFHSNYLEYASPNYNYIRPADDTGFSVYRPRKDEVSLIWKNVFQKPEGKGFPWVNIYVDAATGEMLGGSD